MAMTPFAKATIGHLDIRNALSDISSDILTVQDLAEKAGRTGSVDAEVYLTMALSGLEIKMSNFAETMRQKLA